MRRRLALAAAGLSFLVLLSLVIWQGSFSFGKYGPSDLRETVVIWGVSIVIFLLMVTLGFLLFRALIRLYIDRQSNKEGSRIRWKLLVGALALTLTPVLFSILFSVSVLNRNLDKWFSKPSEQIGLNLRELDQAFRAESKQRAEAQLLWLSALPQVQDAVRYGTIDQAFFNTFCRSKNIRWLRLKKNDGRILTLHPFETTNLPTLQLSVDIRDNDARLGSLLAISALSADVSTKQDAIQSYLAKQADFASHRKYYHGVYFQLIIVITLFILFFASWVAQILSRQIAVPISALLGAAKEVRQGNLGYRIHVSAIDELATLVRAFNEMTNELEGNANELEARRRFTEAILESIPTGVISLSDSGRIEHVNRALRGIFSDQSVDAAIRIEDLFSADDLQEVRYLINRARRMGVAGSQLEIAQERNVLHLAVTVASLEQRRGFVVVIEDTSEILRAQRSAAWQEVARRIAHEIKNPLTPISLCADRIARHISRAKLTPEMAAIFEECTHTIQQEVQSVKALVDAFSQSARLPASQPVAADLNGIVDSAMAVFAGRLDEIQVTLDLDPLLPNAMVDPDQIKRVIVNLIDNAAEAMTESPVKRLFVSTRLLGLDAVELSLSDTGCGVSAADKEKLFLPYFSTKNRGTGLGLAIVSHIVGEHRGRIRVEDNRPSGARFLVELPTSSSVETNGTVEHIEVDSSPATLRL